jgi:hypothetical protein
MASSRKTATNENISTYGDGTRDYSSMVTWEAATDNDLVSATQSEVLECYDDAASFDDYCSLSGAITNSSYFRIVRPASGQGHDGTSNNGFTIANTANVVAFGVLEDYSRVEDLIIKSNLTSGLFGRYVAQIIGANHGALVGAIVFDSSNTSSARNMGGVYSAPAEGESSYVINCLFHNITTTGSGYGLGIRADGSGTTYAYNCTVQGVQDYGMYQTDGTGIAKNICSSGNGTADWDGTWTQTTCTSEGANPTYENAGGDDFHLASGDTVCRGNGTDLSADSVYAFDDDIDGETRSAWDIGFDAYSDKGKFFQMF